MSLPAPLKLIALDADDLAVISTHVQDARVLASDIVWRPERETPGGRLEPAGLGAEPVGAAPVRGG